MDHPNHALACCLRGFFLVRLAVVSSWLQLKEHMYESDSLLLYLGRDRTIVGRTKGRFPEVETMNTQQSSVSCKPARQTVLVTMQQHPAITSVGGDQLPPQRDFQCSEERICSLAGGRFCLVARLNRG